VKAVLDAVAERMSKEEPWNEILWGPVEVLGLDSVLIDSMVVRLSAKTMPGKAKAVERELRWRVKRAFDEADIRIVGGAPVTLTEEVEAADAAAPVAPPSVHSNPDSPQSEAASPIPPPRPAVK
jgi:small conductance mechanosensitive channel